MNAKKKWENSSRVNIWIKTIWHLKFWKLSFSVKKNPELGTVETSTKISIFIKYHMMTLLIWSCCCVITIWYVCNTSNKICINKIQLTYLLVLMWINSLLDFFASVLNYILIRVCMFVLQLLGIQLSHFWVHLHHGTSSA